MSAPGARQRLVSLDDVADHLDVSAATLERWRVAGDGPPWVTSGAVRYRWADVDAWVDAQEQPYREQL